MNQRNLPREDVPSSSRIERIISRSSDRCAPGTPPPLSLPLSLIRISLPRLDGCRVESRPMRWPAVFGIRTRVGPVCSRAFDEWLAWLLCLAWEYDPSILLGRRSSRHWFMKYPILHNSKLSIENAAAPHTDTWAIYDPLGGGGTITV